MGKFNDAVEYLDKLNFAPFYYMSNHFIISKKAYLKIRKSSGNGTKWVFDHGTKPYWNHPAVNEK